MHPLPRHFVELRQYRRPDLLQPDRAPAEHRQLERQQQSRAAATSSRKSTTWAPRSTAASTLQLDYQARPAAGLRRPVVRDERQLPAAERDDTAYPERTPTTAPGYSASPARRSIRAGTTSSARPGTPPGTCRAPLTWRYIGSSRRTTTADDPTLHYSTWGAYDYSTRKSRLTTTWTSQATWNVNKILQTPRRRQQHPRQGSAAHRLGSRRRRCGKHLQHLRHFRPPAVRGIHGEVLIPGAIDSFRAARRPPGRLFLSVASHGPYASIRAMELNQIKRFIKDLEERTDSLRRYL